MQLITSKTIELSPDDIKGAIRELIRTRVPGHDVEHVELWFGDAGEPCIAATVELQKDIDEI